MAKALSIYRGDYKEYPVKVPIAKYTAGGTVFFAAKNQDVIDTDQADITDSDAVVKVQAGDAQIIETTSEYVKYNLIFTPAATDQKVAGTYLGEIQYVNAAGRPTTYSPQFTFNLKADVNRRVS